MILKLIRLFFFISVCIGVSAYELSVVAIFRDEARYLKEWVDYHLLVGVEHFWLYDDGNTDGWEAVLKEYIDADIVEVITWAPPGTVYGFNRQPGAYKDGIEKAIGKTKWLAIIDIDEFIVPMRDESIKECLDKHYQNAGAIYVNWRTFGTGKVTIPEGGSLLYYLKSCALTGHSYNTIGKVIVRPEAAITEPSIASVHYVDLAANEHYFDGNGAVIPLEGGKFKAPFKHCDKFLRINHYILRDEYFFWNYRNTRGDPKVNEEHYKTFSVSKDTAILRFVKKLYPQYFPENPLKPPTTEGKS